MKKPKFHSNYDYTRQGRDEICQGESMTQQEDSMSIQDMLKKQAAGLVQFDSTAVYLDTELDQIDKFNGRALDIDDFQKLQDRINDLNDSAIRQYEDHKKQSKLTESKKEATKEPTKKPDESEDEK